jgi:uncharacterized protein YbjT (DUF2867 family)
MSEVLVTGGTGDLGRELVPKLVARGHNVRVLSRKANPAVPAGVRGVKGDLMTGDGLGEALDGIDVLVHCATGSRDSGARGLLYGRARTTDVEPTATMLRAATSKPHVVYISIVGIDKIPLGYYRAKLDCEHLIEQSGLPYTIFRTTQWHSLAWEFCRRLVRGPLVVTPKGVTAQLLDPSEVAERMAAIVDEGPARRVPDMGGPERFDFKEIVAKYLSATGKRARIASVPVPGKAMKAFRAGYNCVPGRGEGKITFDEWLSRRTAI